MGCSRGLTRPAFEIRDNDNLQVVRAVTGRKISRLSLSEHATDFMDLLKTVRAPSCGILLWFGPLPSEREVPEIAVGYPNQLRRLSTCEPPQLLAGPYHLSEI